VNKAATAPSRAAAETAINRYLIASFP